MFCTFISISGTHQLMCHRVDGLVNNTVHYINLLTCRRSVQPDASLRTASGLDNRSTLSFSLMLLYFLSDLHNAKPNAVRRHTYLFKSQGDCFCDRQSNILVLLTTLSANCSANKWTNKGS